MSSFNIRTYIRRSLAFAAAFWCLAASAAAQEVCVVCTGPAATYRCTVEKSEKLARLGNIGDKALQHICIKELARQSGHATCSVRNDTTTALCDGTLREIPIASLIAPPPETPQAPAPVVAKAPEPPAPVKEGPPRTVKELAERTGETSKKQLQSVGDSVGTAATKTWDCLTSLFKRC